jgi:hypothetical protein
MKTFFFLLYNHKMTTVASSPLTSNSIAGNQILFSYRKKDALRYENVGRCVFEHNGALWEMARRVRSYPTLSLAVVVVANQLYSSQLPPSPHT